MSTSTAIDACRYVDDTHTYYKGEVVVPSCTQVLESSGLIEYSRVSPDVLERKSALGQAVHAALHFVLTGDDLDWESVHEKAVPYVMAGERFVKEVRFKPTRVEEPRVAVVNGMPYGMKPDAEGLVDNSIPFIFDFKCALKEEASWAIQSAGYSLGAGETGVKGYARWKRAMVQLKPDGSHKVFCYEDRNDDNVFQWALALTHFKINKGIPWRA